MFERCRHPRLPAETTYRVRVGLGELTMQYFDRDMPTQGWLLCLVNPSHAPFAQESHYAELIQQLNANIRIGALSLYRYEPSAILLTKDSSLVVSRITLRAP